MTTIAEWQADNHTEINNSPDPYARPLSNSIQVMTAFLEDVKQRVTKDRQQDYDVPERNHTRAAVLMSASTGLEINAKQVCLINLAQKLSRMAHKITYDSCLDVAGYAANLVALLAIDGKQPNDDD